MVRKFSFQNERTEIKAIALEQIILATAASTQSLNLYFLFISIQQGSGVPRQFPD
jgi:hypothetical protein